MRTEELYAQFGRTVSGLCRALLRDAAEAEDAMQQTFLSAHRALVNGSRPREPAAWLAAIARNECWARIRTRMCEPLPSDALETRMPGASDPVAEALRRADLAALWTAIGALPPVQRDALLLREFGGLSYEELAAALAVSEPAVESLLFRARRRLRVQLRAALAALTGASWLEALARLVAGGGAPAAAKVAVLGVGAAALGSGAAVVPQVFDNHHPSRLAPQHVVRPIHPRPKPLHHVAPLHVAVVPVAAEPQVRSERREEGRGGSDDRTTAPTASSAVATVEDRHGGDDGRNGGGSSGPDGRDAHDGGGDGEH